MKSFAFLFFFGLSITGFAANTVSEEPSILISDLEINNTESFINKENTPGTDENDTILQYCYAVEWLNKDSPFIEKLKALA